MEGSLLDVRLVSSCPRCSKKDKI